MLSLFYFRTRTILELSCIFHLPNVTIFTLLGGKLNSVFCSYKNVGGVYLRGLEIPELNEEDVPMIF